MISRLKELEAENARLKKMFAEEHLKADILKEAMAKKWQGYFAARNGHKSSLGVRDFGQIGVRDIHGKRDLLSVCGET